MVPARAGRPGAHAAADAPGAHAAADALGAHAAALAADGGVKSRDLYAKCL